MVGIKGMKRAPTIIDEYTDREDLSHILKWRLRNPEKAKLMYKRARYRKYGLELAEVKREGECPICLKEKKLVVDHCHTSGLVRDFICYNCNTVLGHIENPDKLKRIVEYLTRHKSPVSSSFEG